MCISFMCGFVALVVGLTFTFTMPPFDPTFENISSLILWSGILLVIIGLVLIPSARREVVKIRSIIEIVTSRNEVTISEISSETGLDREYLRDRISKFLVQGLLFGALEDDLFICDTSKYRGIEVRDRDLFDAND
ncbi:MAG: hypothetical protein RTU63_04205 [Candidatus Thorarchaeota archaeon]